MARTLSALKNFFSSHAVHFSRTEGGFLSPGTRKKNRGRRKRYVRYDLTTVIREARVPSMSSVKNPKSLDVLKVPNMTPRSSAFCAATRRAVVMGRALKAPIKVFGKSRSRRKKEEAKFGRGTRAPSNKMDTSEASKPHEIARNSANRTIYTRNTPWRNFRRKTERIEFEMTPNSVTSQDRVLVVVAGSGSPPETLITSHSVLVTRYNSPKLHVSWTRTCSNRFTQKSATTLSITVRDGAMDRSAGDDDTI